MTAPIEDERGRRAPTPKALESLAPVPDGYRILPDPLNGQPLVRVPAQPVEVRLLLSRSSESARAGEPTQDYLVVRHDPRHLAFAIADGVGSSFLGDVAAQIVAAALTDWIVTATPPLLEPLTAFLHELSARVADQVAAWPLPANLTPIMRDALDAQRAYGSEAMFAVGVVDFRQGTVSVAWLGDVRVRLIRRDGTVVDHTGQTSDRWSSRSGPRGAISGETWPVSELARVVVGTDGLVPEIEAALTLGDAELAQRLAALALRPRNDDVAMVDVGLLPRAIPGEAVAVVSAGRHARGSTAGSVVRRLLKAVTPPTLPPEPGSPAPPPPPAPPGPPASPTGTRTMPKIPGPAPLTPTLTMPRIPADPTLPPPTQPPPPTASPTGAPPTASPAGAPPTASPAGAPPTASPTGASLAGLPPTAPPVPAGPPPPVIMRRRLERGQEIIWSAVDGADSYAVQISREPRFTEPIDYAVRGLAFTVPPLPDPVFARIRSVAAGGEPGPWSPKYDLSLSDPA